MNFPENLKYTKDHEWILVDGNTGTVGITEYAQGELGDVVFVELPAVGKSLKTARVVRDHRGGEGCVRSLSRPCPGPSQQ